MYSIFDSGSSTIQVPDPVFESYVRQIFKEVGSDEYQISFGKVISKCFDNYPTLHFMFDKTWLTVDPSDYVVDASPEQDRSICLVLVSRSDSPFLVMGLPLMTGYYTVHDDEASRLGFVPHVGSSKTGPFWGAVPKRGFGDAEAQKEFSDFQNEVNED